MKLEGIHHITAITGDAPRNVEFYAGTLGLRMVKKTVNQDDPTVYHLFYADEQGSPGADLTFFEYPGAAQGRPGPGQVHRIVWRVGSPEAIDFWAKRLEEHGFASERVDGGLRFADPEGLDHELRVSDVPDAPLIAQHPESRASTRSRASTACAPTRSTPPAARRCCARRSASRAARTGAGRSAATSAAASTPTTRRRAAAPRRAPAASTTSPSRRRWTSRTPGASASRTPATPTRPR